MARGAVCGRWPSEEVRAEASPEGCASCSRKGVWERGPLPPQWREARKKPARARAEQMAGGPQPRACEEEEAAARRLA